jgi:hypothetical protein
VSRPTLEETDAFAVARTFPGFGAPEYVVNE